MTKIQLQNAATQILNENKASKALKEAVNALLLEYVSTTRGESGTKRERELEVDGSTYRWCQRHEAYEPVSNFRTDKDNYCRLAVKVWQHLGKDVNAADETREAAIESGDYDMLPELSEALASAKALRKGRYNYDDNALQFNEIHEYTYDALIAEDAV